jgi:ATP-binding cassette subfamily B protein
MRQPPQPRLLQRTITATEQCSRGLGVKRGGRVATPRSLGPVKADDRSNDVRSRSAEWPAVRKLLGERRRAVVHIAVVSVIGALLEAFFLIIVTRTAFAVTDGRDRFGVVAGIELSVGQVVIVGLVVIALRVTMAITGTWFQAELMSSYVADAREELADAFLGAEWSAQHGERSGRLQELLTSFVYQGATLTWATAQAIISACSLGAMLLIAVAVDPLSAIAVIGAVAILGAVLRPLRAAVKRQADRASQSSMAFATSLSEFSQLGMEMHVFNVQPQVRRQLRERVASDREASRRLGVLRGLVPSAYTGIAYIAILIALSVVAAVESANLDTIGAVMLVMLRSLSYGQSMQVSIASISSSLPFLRTLDDELHRYRSAAVVDLGASIGDIGELRFQDVSFEYVRDSPVLHSVTAVIEPNELVGIVGPSGSGKSTLVQLLLGLREPTRGTILADGRDIRTLSKVEWARKVTFVPQQARLIAGTVAENIRFMRDHVSLADIERAAALAQLHREVQGFADGYERQVGEQGSHLSGGQQQRLIIARALVEHPDVLILDEPTSSLDVRSESLIRETLGELRRAMTVIVIAHRLSTLAICDRIMVIQDGELKAFDTPTNLERDNEFYREALVLSGLR